MKIKYLCALLFVALVYSCDDSTTGIGDGLIPDGDRIPANVDNGFEFSTNSLLADSVYARTSTAYLGRYTDEQFGEFSADFMAQFTCLDNFEFDEDLSKITSVSMMLQYSTFFGDSLNAMRLQVDTLDKVIPENLMSTFYTSVNPADYYNEKGKPLAVKAYSAVGPSTELDSTYTVNYQTYRIIQQKIKFPTSLGEFIYNKYKEDKNYFKNSETFISNVLKGVYVRCTHGDGTILYIDDIRLILNYEALIESSSGTKDSIAYREQRFFATKEVIQANSFRNSDKLKNLVANPSYTYIKSPAGIFTEATFPIAGIYDEHKNDTLNGVSVTFTRYNDKINSKYKMSIPANLLMVRKKDMFTFFEENKIADSKTSFLSTYSSSSNTYSFTNIAPLITYCIEERKRGIISAGGEPENPEDAAKWEKENPDWNKVVLIPVNIESTGSVSNGNYQIVGVSNSLGMESATLKGGTNPDNKLKMKIFYTSF